MCGLTLHYVRHLNDNELGICEPQSKFLRRKVMGHAAKTYNVYLIWNIHYIVFNRQARGFAMLAFKYQKCLLRVPWKACSSGIMKLSIWKCGFYANAREIS